MRKSLLLIGALFFSTVANADVYLQSGSSSWINRGTKVHCGYSQPSSDRRYQCSYQICTSKFTVATDASSCRFHNRYRSETVSVWAFSGSQAERKAKAKIREQHDANTEGDIITDEIIDIKNIYCN